MFNAPDVKASNTWALAISLIEAIVVSSYCCCYFVSFTPSTDEALDVPWVGTLVRKFYTLLNSSILFKWGGIAPPGIMFY